MLINSDILHEIQKNNNVITTSQVLLLGYSKSLLTKYVKAGILVRSSHGIYTLPDTVNDDMYERTPFQHSLTIPSDSALPASIGMIEKETIFGNRVRCYNMERTICDLLRSRSRCDKETSCWICKVAEG